MKQEWILIFLIALSLFTMQAVGGYFQIKDYKKAIRRVHRLGNVGIGQKEGHYRCGSDGRSDVFDKISGAGVGYGFSAGWQPYHGIPCLCAAAG